MWNVSWGFDPLWSTWSVELLSVMCLIKWSGSAKLSSNVELWQIREILGVGNIQIPLSSLPPCTCSQGDAPGGVL